MSHNRCELCRRIYEENKERLNWYMWKWFSWLNREDIHDILQDTWEKLMENIDTVGELEPSEQFKWLATVCHNQAISFLRKQGRIVEQDSETIGRLLDAKKAISLEDEVIERVMLKELLDKLSEEDRKILFMSEFSKRKGKKNQTNAETCKLYRVKKKLKKLLREGDWRV